MFEYLLASLIGPIKSSPNFLNGYSSNVVTNSATCWDNRLTLITSLTKFMNNFIHGGPLVTYTKNFAYNNSFKNALQQFQNATPVIL